jgi:dihydroorotate dehydrogenase
MGHGTPRRTGWYRAIARPLFFALPPESAHRVAHAMLGLPLPWERLGAADRDPSLRLRLAGIELANAVGLAAGFDKRGSRLDALGRLGFGYVVGGTFTRRHREGNPRPRILRYRHRVSMTNAMGLPNPGAEAAARTIGTTPRTSPRFASIADEDVVDVLETHALLEPHVDAVELNASCPNVSWGRDRDNERHLETLVRELGRRRSTPLFVKLPPFRSAIEREVVLALARIAQEGGADGLTCSNTLPVRDARLSIGAGGLSGRALFEGTLAIVEDVARETAGELPINASGGILSAADALACLQAGATTVQVYTALIFEGPAVVGDLTAGLASARPRSSSRSLGLAEAP